MNRGDGDAAESFLPGLEGLGAPDKSSRDRVVNAVVRRVARELQRMKDRSMRLSGDDSPLRSVWDELCVQQQAFDSTYVAAYRETLKAVVEGQVAKTNDRELRALWTLTPDGEDWYFDVRHGHPPDPKKEHPVIEGIVEVLTERVLSYACDYSNARIRRYLERE